MRALRLFALAAALVVPAAAAHAQVSVYVGPSHHGYVRPVYGPHYGYGYGYPAPAYGAYGYHDRYRGAPARWEHRGWSHRWSGDRRW